MLNKDANKTLNFCPIFKEMGFLKAELSGQIGNMSKFYLTPIWIIQYLSKFEGIKPEAW